MSNFPVIPSDYTQKDLPRLRNYLRVLRRVAFEPRDDELEMSIKSSSYLTFEIQHTEKQIDLLSHAIR